MNGEPRIPLEAALAIFQRLVKDLHQRTVITQAVAGGGPGARRYSRTKLLEKANMAAGAYGLLKEMYHWVDAGADVPEGGEAWRTIFTALKVAEGRS